MDWLMVAVLCLGQGEGQRTIPPLACELKTGPELLVFNRRLEELEGAIGKLTRQIEKADRGGQDASSLVDRRRALQEELESLTRLDPETSRLHGEIFLPALRDLEAAFPGPLTGVNQAEQLLDSLYLDLGHPSLNYRFAVSGPLSRIIEEAKDQSVDRAVRERLLAGLMEYARDTRDGELLPTPGMKNDLAEALIRLGNNDGLSIELAQTLINDSLVQSELLQRTEEIAATVEHFRRVRAITLPERFLFFTAIVSEIDVPDSREAVALWHQFLLEAEGPTREQQELRVQAWLTFLRQEADRDGVSKSRLAVIEAGLRQLWLFCTERASDPQTFRLWVGAASSFGLKTSKSFQQFVRDERKGVDVQKKNVVSGLDQLIKGFEQGEQ